MIPFAAYVFLYVLGLKYVIPYAWVFEARRFELTGKVFGVAATQYHKNWWITALLALPGMFLPVLITLLFQGSHWGGMAMAAPGLVGVLWRRTWIAVAVRRLEKKRYVVMEEFRKR